MLLGAALWGAAPRAADAGLILREVRAREVGNPFIIYEAEIVLSGPPGTFINGSLDRNERDLFTIFDIPNLAIVLTTQDNWAPSHTGALADPPGTILIPPDLPEDFNNPALPDITFSYFGNSPIVLGDLAELVIGTFRWQTFHTNPRVFADPIRYAWQTSRMVDGVLVKETGSNSAPVAITRLDGAVNVPEPSTLVMTALGLGLGAALLRSRGRSSPRGGRPS